MSSSTFLQSTDSLRRDQGTETWQQVQRVIAAVALVLLLPLFVVLFLAVKLTSRGPFLYGQRRPGLHGRLFTTWKIRSMRPGSDRNAALARCVRSANPEVTRIGRVLRKLKLDELPQLWNVVLGEMAFVGPRPIAVPLYEELCQKIAGFERRTLVRPGLTNLGQICIEENAGPEQVVDDWRIRFEAELHYLDNRSVAYDVVIAVMTVLYMVRKAFGNGRRRVVGTC
jgi:lipopolysaccharide/colanic/teichoic acid biosynthesis glycosyltransferase